MLLFISAPGSTEIIIFSVIAFFLGVLFTRWLFRINEMADNLKYQTKLLMKIAKYNNVPHDEIYKALEMTPPPDLTASRGKK